MGGNGNSVTDDASMVFGPNILTLSEPRGSNRVIGGAGKRKQQQDIRLPITSSAVGQKMSPTRQPLHYQSLDGVNGP